MRTIRLRRLAVLVFAALGLLSTMASPADATGTGTVAFQGTAVLIGGLSYPCVGGPPPTVNTEKCPTPVVNGVNGSCPGGHAACVTGGWTRTVQTFSSDVCAGAGAFVPSGVVDPAAPCSITASGTVTGSCGLSSGLVDFSITFGHVPGTGNQDTLLITGRVHWIAVGGTLILTGQTGGNGVVTGVVQATPLPETSLPGTGIDNSCSSKSADRFNITGAATVVIP